MQLDGLRRMTKRPHGVGGFLFLYDTLASNFQKTPQFGLLLNNLSAFGLFYLESQVSHLP